MISAIAAEWACGLAIQQMPVEAVRNVKLQLLDIIGTMLAARDTDIVRSVHASALAGGGHAGVHAIGFPERMSASSAALLNGAAALVMEFDNSHIKTGIHVTSSVVAAALPIAAELKLSGAQLIEALAVGTELTCRLGLIAPGMFHRHGFHPTPIFGIFGATYAAAKCRGLDARRTMDAIGLSGSLSAGSMASWEDGTSAKSLHGGLAASSAVLAGSLAAHGLTGPSVIFDGRFGFFKAHVQEEDYAFDFDALHRRLGIDWELNDIAPKAYPCGHYIQPSIEAALALQSAHGFSAEDVAELHCALADYTIPLVALPTSEKTRPASPFQARFSLQHSVAEALAYGRIDRHSYSPQALADPRVNALAARVTFDADPVFSDRSRLGGEVTIRLKDGLLLHRRIEHMRGMPQNPMSTDDLVSKFKANAEDVLSPAAMEEAIDRIMRLEQFDDLRSLLELLSIGMPLRHAIGEPAVV
jgi:2-methylcitrate dehydratase PrpD